MSGGAEGKQLVSGGAGGRLCVSGGTGQQKKIIVMIFSRPFLVPFLVPAFTGTHFFSYSVIFIIIFMRQLLCMARIVGLLSDWLVWALDVFS